MTLDSDLVARVTDALSADAPPTATTELDGGHVGRVYRLDFDYVPSVEDALDELGY